MAGVRGRGDTGGSRIPRLPPGFFFEPTVFTDVQDHMFIAREESFGPVMIISRFADGYGSRLGLLRARPGHQGLHVSCGEGAQTGGAVDAAGPPQSPLGTEEATPAGGGCRASGPPGCPPHLSAPQHAGFRLESQRLHREPARPQGPAQHRRLSHLRICSLVGRTDRAWPCAVSGSAWGGRAGLLVLSVQGWPLALLTEALLVFPAATWMQC